MRKLDRSAIWKQGQIQQASHEFSNTHKLFAYTRDLALISNVLPIFNYAEKVVVASITYVSKMWLRYYFLALLLWLLIITG